MSWIVSSDEFPDESVYGPFDSERDAVEWIKSHIGKWKTILLKNPTGFLNVEEAKKYLNDKGFIEKDLTSVFYKDSGQPFAKCAKIYLTAGQISIKYWMIGESPERGSD